MTMNNLPNTPQGKANNMEFVSGMNIDKTRINQIFAKQHLMLKYNTSDFAYAFKFTN